MFDPNLPANLSVIDAEELRNQFNALKALIDLLTMQVSATNTQVTALTAQLVTLANLVPMGGVIPWFKDTPGVPALPSNFVECNGQILSDPESPLDGQVIPDINTGVQRFIRGGLNSGTEGGIDYFATAQADNAGIGAPQNFVTTDFSPGAQPFPPYITAVYVMRVR
jgi:hypothetical protein